MSSGKVWLVGAGPGDAALMTLKGRRVLEEADVIVYDSLVGDALLSGLPYGVRLINVGKRSSNHTMPQEEINRLLLDEALKGNKVVRLKGGDPFLFGRGGEELELLAENHIDYEVVPGVTSALAVPEYNGIPVTHRDFTSSLHIITGHKRAGKDYDIDFEALVRTKGTLIFLMGVNSLREICSGLMGAGMDGETPAALLEKGTTAHQKRILATVGTLADEVERRGAETPGIIVVGQVCQLADRFSWYEDLPLGGWKVVLTRPAGMISRMAGKLRMAGAEVLELPSVETVPREPCPELADALGRIGEYQWLVLTSPTGVKVLRKNMERLRMDVRSLAPVRIAVIGKGTERELRKIGIYPDMIPSRFDGDTLGEELAMQIEAGDRVLIPRASAGNQALVRFLEKAGASVDDVATYDTVPARRGVVDEKELFSRGEIDCAVFTSASTVRGFVQATEGLDHSRVKAACIGRQTADAAKSFGMETYVAEEATMDSLLKLICEMKKEGM